MPHFDPNESLGFHCNLTVKSFLSAWERKLRKMDVNVSPAQLVALAQLLASGPLSQTELVDRLSIKAATGVRLVDRMERDGWVVRKSDAKDGRVKLVVPTKHVMEFWEKISKTGRSVLERAYRGVTPAELETVKRILERVRNNLEK